MTTQVSGISVAFEELEQSPQEKRESGSFKAIRKLRCAWSDRQRLMDQLLGGVEVSGVRRLPDAYPGVPGVYAVRCEAKPMGGLQTPSADLRYCQYLEALIEVYYESVDWEVAESGPRYTEKLIPLSESIALPADGLEWKSDDERVRFLKPELSAVSYVYELAYYQVTQLPAGWSGLVGKVNDDVVVSRSLGRNFEAKKLLFEAPSFSRTQGANDLAFWDVKYRMRFRLDDAADWNDFRRLEKWDQVKRTGEQEAITLYEEASFMPILRFFDD